jgi:hypothetical protein
MIAHRVSYLTKALVVACILTLSCGLKGQQVTSTWLGGTGNWNDPLQWSSFPFFPNNNSNVTYSAIINSGNATLNQDITVSEFGFGQIGSPTLQGNGDFALNVSSNLILNQGSVSGMCTLNALGAATISGTSTLYGWYLNLSGNTAWNGQLAVGNTSVISNYSTGTIGLSDGAVCTYHYDSSNINSGVRRMDNYGIINANGGSTGAILDINLNNYGAINVNSGTLVLAGGGTITGNINVENGATVDIEPTNVPDCSPATSACGNYDFTPTSSIAGGGTVKFNSGTATIRGAYNVTGSTIVGYNSGGVAFVSPITNLGTSLTVGCFQMATVNLGANTLALPSLTLQSGALSGSGKLTVSGSLEWREGSMTGTGTTNANNGVFFNGLTDDNQFDTLDRTLSCYGTSLVQTTNAYQGNIYFGSHAVLNIMPSATFNGSRLAIQGSSSGGTTYGTLTNYGTIVIDDPGLNRGMSAFGIAFENEGTIRVTNSSLDVRTSTGSPAINQDGCGSSIVLQNGTLRDTLSINSGSLIGNGSVSGVVSNGRIAPSGGDLNFLQGTLTLKPDSLLSYVLDGRQPGVSYGRMTNISTATLAGILEVTITSSFRTQITSSDSFTVLSGSSISGQFSNVLSGSRLYTADGSGSFLVTYSGTTSTFSDFQPSAAVPPLQLVDIASEKIHGTLGTFDIDLPASGRPGIECRSGGAAGNYELVFTFTNSLVSVGSAILTVGTGTITSSGIDCSDPYHYIVNLTGVTNAQVITVSLGTIQDTFGNLINSTSVSMGVLIGDTNGDGFVDAVDVSQTKSRSGTVVTGSDFREDLNLDGFVDAVDTAFVKSKSGTALPSFAYQPTARRTKRASPEIKLLRSSEH